MPNKGDTYFMDSGPLFDAARALVRTGDPETSHEAAESIVESGSMAWKREQLAKLVEEFPGSTASEIQEKFEYLGNHGHLWKRVKECVDAGMIRKGDPRKCKVTGHDAATLYLVEK